MVRFRERRVGWVIGVCLALVAAGPDAVAQDYTDVTIERHDLGGGVYMLTGSGGNLAASVGEDGVLLVDDQFAPLTERILASLAEVSPERPRFVLNTHWHGDHTGGNENLEAAGSVIVAHATVRKRMSTEQFVQAFGRKVPASPPGALPVLSFERSLTFHLNGQDILAFHVPAAHTDGDVVVHFRGADVIHTGDTLFNGFYPFIDLSSGGSIGGLIAAVEQVLAIAGPATQIIPGHGVLAARADLVVYRDMLVTARDRVQQLIDEGKNPEAIVAAKPTADLDAKWGGGFMKPDFFTATLAQSLIGN
jgi:cyclase